MRLRIIEAARKRFFSYGLKKVTMDEIASDLGISKKTLYKHFSGKHELAAAVIRSFQEEITALLGDMKNKIPDPIERFGKLVIEISRRRSEMCNRFPADIKTDIPELWAEIQNFRESQTIHNMGEILREGMKKGQVRKDVNTEIAAMLYMGAIQAIMQPDVMEEKNISAADAFADISKIFLEGVKV